MLQRKLNSIRVNPITMSTVLVSIAIEKKHITSRKAPRQKKSKRVLRDLEIKKTLCYIKDYPAVELKKLNHYITKLGPLMNSVFGEKPAFFFDEGRFIPYRMFVYGNAIVATEIDVQLRNWATWLEKGGRASTSQGAFIFGNDDQNTGRRVHSLRYP